MNTIIQSIVAIGGFGFLNYEIVSRVSDIDLGDEQDKKYFIFLFSSLDYSLFLMWQNWISNTFISIFFSIITAIVISMFSPMVLKIIFRVINKIRGYNKLPELSPQTMYDIFATDLERQNCFIFDLKNKNVISSGFIANTSGLRDDLSIILYPYILENSPKKYNIQTEEELLNYLDKEKIQAKIYINLEKQIKIIYF